MAKENASLSGTVLDSTRATSSLSGNAGLVSENRIQSIFRMRFSLACQLCLGLSLLPLFFLSGTLFAQSSAQKSLDRFKSMVGTWQGKSPGGDTSEVTYTLAAGGTAVMAEMHMAGDEMMSMYYVNGDELLMTHFCPSGNQPRMKAVISPDLNTVSFDFMDATNLPGPNTGHMHRAVFLFSDADHYTEEWTWKKADKDTKMHYEMLRKK